ncbi:hypothetical protein LCGC14_1883480 [marine sediment metagenome]|uniref:HTH cro/C1-type domain-containing protein n=1 Tax=marine sediment metagenome TaxID=412755 RepID=A0A0F9G1G6_9ZZZZ
MKIGENLRKLRNNKGLSLRELQKKVGISYITLGSYERDAIKPTIYNCYKLCKYFEVPLEYLFLGEDSLKDFHDVDLLLLFNKVDRLENEGRTTIKKYIIKYLQSKKELDQIKKEAE